MNWPKNCNKELTVILNLNDKEGISVFILYVFCYFCGMNRIIFFLFLFLIFSPDISQAQAFIKTSDLFQNKDENDSAGRLNITQNPGIDTLISRYILSNKKHLTTDGSQGMEGFRIQIYYNSSRSAREGSAKAKAEFISKFPDIDSYAQYTDPGYFKIRVGNYRTKTEGFKDFMLIRKEFPDAYFVPDVINFPDVNKK